MLAQIDKRSILSYLILSAYQASRVRVKPNYLSIHGTGLPGHLYGELLLTGLLFCCGGFSGGL